MTKTVARVVVPVRAITRVVAKSLAAVSRTLAEVEGLVYNGIRSVIMGVLDVGPTWMRSAFSRVLNPIFDAMMATSRLKLGVGLLALGALSSSASLRLEGRLELLTASLYFVRAFSGIPKWLQMAVMVAISMFLPMLAIVMIGVMVASLLLMKWQLPKLEKDPDAMIRHLFMLRKYGLLDKETNELLDLYADRLKRPDLHDDTGFYGYVGGYEYEAVELRNAIANIRDVLNDHDTGFQGVFEPGNVVAPPAIQKKAGTDNLTLLALSAALAIALARLA